MQLHELHGFLYTHAPDVVVLNETWLKKFIHDNEILPCDLHIKSNKVNFFKAQAELLSVMLRLSNGKNLCISTFYWVGTLREENFNEFSRTDSDTPHIYGMQCTTHHIFKVCSALHTIYLWYAVHYTPHIYGMQCTKRHIFMVCSALHATYLWYAVHYTPHFYGMQCTTHHIFMLCSALHTIYLWYAVHYTPHIYGMQCTTRHIFMVCSALHATYLWYAVHYTPHIYGMPWYAMYQYIIVLHYFS